MEEKDLYWLAGLLEGEGSFDLHEKGGGRTARPRVSMSSTDEDVIAEVSRLLGVSSYSRYRPKAWPRHKDKFTVELDGPRAVELMTQIRPYMFSRRAGKISEVLDGR